MLKTLQKFLTIVLVIFGSLYLMYQGFLYSRVRTLMPEGTVVAGLDVSGLSRDEAGALLSENYLTPLPLYYREERVEIRPDDVGFVLDLETMLNEAEARAVEKELWQGYLEFMVGRALEPAEIELRATHDRDALLQRLQTIAAMLDMPAVSPQLLGASTNYKLGEPGYVARIDESLPLVESALYRLENREVQLIIEDQPAPGLDITYLQENLEKQIAAFDGIGAVFVMDLATGEELGINADVAISGLSIVKIPIILETYRALDSTPNSDQKKLIEETAIVSGDYSANLLLDVVAGQDNAYLGADILTESMHRLGLKNTFIVTPYEEPNRAGKATLVTVANSRTDISTLPDPAMQTTAEDIGTLLSMIYHCAKGGGALLAVYPDQLTPEECQATLDIMVRNTEGNLIRFGVPETARVSHKHGWAGNTHGDAGIVFSPGGDYVIVEYLSQPYTDWLVIDVSFPILRELSRATYNFFNFDNPNTEDPQVRAEREAAAREAEATPTAEDAVSTEAAPSDGETTTP